MPKIKFFSWIWAWGAPEKTYRNQALGLGFLYFAELFSYQAFSLLPNDKSFEFLKGNDWITLALHCGMLLGALGWCLWILKRPKLTYRVALRRSVLFYTVPLSAIVFMAFCIANGMFERDVICLKWAFAIARFLFGVGFSAGLGLTVVLIAEEFPRYLRTKAATLACAIGFLGPLIAAGLYWIALWKIKGSQSDSSILILVLGMLLAWLSLVIIWPESKKEVFDRTFFSWNDGHLTRHAWTTIKKITGSGEASSIFWSCAFMGVSISFFSDLLHLLPRMDVYKDIIGSDFVFCWRYVGIALGTLWAGWQSWHNKSRKEVIFQLLAFQILALVALLFLPLVSTIIANNVGPWSMYPNGLKANFGGVCLCAFTLVISGIANANWIVMLLHTFEQFGKAHRAIAVILVINVYRFGSIGLIGLNLLHPNWYNSFHFALLGLGILYIGIGLVASQHRSDNFEGDALEADYTPLDRTLSGSDVRKEILKIEENFWESEDESRFLNRVSGILYARMSDILRENYYLSTLYFAQESDARLGSAGIHERKETFRVRGLEAINPKHFHEVGENLIENGAFDSLALWLEGAKDLEGVLLWYGGSGQYLDRERLHDSFQDTQSPRFKSFNLSSIQLPDNSEAYYTQILRPGLADMDARQNALEALEKEAIFEESAWESFWGRAYDASDPAAKGIRRNLLFQRLEASGRRYLPGLLFVYYIKPHATRCADLRGILFLKTADQLSKNHIAELREILSWVLLQRAAALLRRSNNQILQEERHANWHELNSLTERLKETKQWFSQVKERAQKSQFNGLEAENFAQNFDPAFQTIKHLRDLNEYNAFLTKVGSDRSSKRISLDIQDKYKILLENHPLDLQKELLSEVSNMKMNPEIIRLPTALSDEKRKSIALACLSELEKSIHKAFENQNVIVMANPVGLRVVLHELLKNAARHANPREPQLSITWARESEKLEGYSALHFHNNWDELFGKNREKQKQFFETIHDGIEYSHRTLGIRSVRRFVGFRYFSNRPWFLSCEDPREAQIERTDIYLLIPQSALKIEH